MADSFIPMNLKSEKGMNALQIARELNQAGHQALFAGGCVRDYLLGTVPTDYDIATSATPDQVEKIFKKTIPVGRQFGVMLVLMNGIQFEVATFRTEGGYQDGRRPGFIQFSSAEEDARRRDFTVNGIFYDPIQNRILDFVEGVSDLQAKVIRCIGDPSKRFEEDKLRLLRAIRFSSRLGFSIAPETWSEMKRRPAEIQVVSMERIRDEIEKMLLAPSAARSLDLLLEVHLLQYVLPDFEEQAKDFPLHMSKHSYFQLARTRLDLLQLRTPALIWAALFLDFELSSLWKNSKNLYKFLHDLRVSNDVLSQVADLISFQKNLQQLANLRLGKILLLLGDKHLDAALELCKVNSQAVGAEINVAAAWGQWKLKYQGHNLRPKPWLSGHDLIALEMKPGPAVKEVLEEAYLLQLEGQLISHEQALGWAGICVKKGSL